MRILSIAIVLFLGFESGPLPAGEAKIFRVDSRDTFLEGRFEGVSLDSLGGLELAADLRRLATPEEPFVFTAAAHPEGWVLGTGNGGRVLFVRPDGSLEEALAAPEPEVFALAVAKDGTVFAGTSPNGKVYRLERRAAGWQSEVVYEPGTVYIWDLAVGPGGDLWVATGLEGRVIRVPRRSEAEVVLADQDPHMRSLAVAADGSLLIGTAGQGRILRLAEDGPLQTLHDALHPEVSSFVAGQGGVVYAALLASEASQVSLADEQEGDAGDGGVSVTVGSEAVGSRGSGFQGPRSLLVEISSRGTVRELESFEDETIHSLMWRDGTLWIGTGEDGKLYRYSGNRLVLEKDFEESQVVALVSGGAGPAVVTTNVAAIYRLTGRRAERGTYLSKVLDAGMVARFGSFSWFGEQPAETAVELSVRSGMSAEPDATWTPWSEPVGGRELSLTQLPRGRYVQWRAALAGGQGATPRLLAAELSYVQENLQPRVVRFEALPPGQIFVPSNFNPGQNVFEPWSPTRDGIFTSLREASGTDTNRPKTLYKRGYRTLRWEAKDGNEDKLRYSLAFRQERDEGWLPMVEDLEESHYSFDGTSLPDGIYRFRVTATDRPSQNGDHLSAEEISPPVILDHTPPELLETRREGNHLVVRLKDAWSPIRLAEVSLNAAAWTPAEATDGLLDGRQEELRIQVPEDTQLLLLRVADSAFNLLTIDLLEGAP